MPSLSRSYEVLLDFANDTHDFITVQLLRDYGRNTGAVMLLNPGETITLVLDSGAVYQYAVKLQTKVANVTARSWRDIRCDASHLFTPAPLVPTARPSGENGITVDRVWRDYRFFVCSDS
ncbi:hypothetical protein HGRIS_007819 [Hohenbuehelia grisea]|uniref:Plastocyanin-like domain-containing protein n=1 Tax=Hohenbuehelia grisea TaxID=104357 RepID=A0ABR3J6F8_9AGAR